MDRIALVIGNSDYSNVGKLNNPKNDADDIASILNKLNFDVTKIMDANLIDIQKSVNDFLQALDEYAVGVFFYAGHGMQIDGKNFIVPIDLKLSDKSKTMVSCYCLNSLLEGASSYKGKTLICILDACRDNPFAMGRGFLTGFAPFNNPPKGTMIAYSTSADCSAFDGQCSNGLYTQVLKDAMLIPNLKIEEMFKFVRNKVSEISISQYGEEQLSWEYSSLVGDFYFSVTPQPVNEQVTDEKIYEFICARRKSYENASDNIYGRLPYHVRILCDEFANIGQIPKFDKLIATIRSREISASIILQSQSQLKTIYKDAAETILGNCDTMLFLGGKESSTLKEISETLGKETIDLYNTSDTRGQSRSYGMNYQKTGKELMSRDELAVMDGSKCILQLRGVRPFFSDKFDITRHKRYKELSDYDKKNEFDVEAYMRHRMEVKLTRTQEFDLYEFSEESLAEELNTENKEAEHVKDSDT